MTTFTLTLDGKSPISGNLQLETKPLPKGELFYLKNYWEVGPIVAPPPPIGNFTAITLFADSLGKTGGQTNWIELNLNEINFIKDLNIDSYKDWRWADSPMGTIYLGQDWQTDTQVRWPRIALASNEDGNRNIVSVLEYSNDNRFCLIEGIPESFSYKQYYACEWLIHTAYTVYPTGHTGYLALYKMPIFDPAGGFKISLGGDGLWLQRDWLYGKV